MLFNDILLDVSIHLKERGRKNGKGRSEKVGRQCREKGREEAKMERSTHLCLYAAILDGRIFHQTLQAFSHYQNPNIYTPEESSQ